MIFIVHASTTRRTIENNLGEADYSYHFVLERFRPLLEEMGRVVEIFREPEVRVDAVYDIFLKLGEPCLFLSFTPPHKTLLHLRCPTVCVFAWEFYDLPRAIGDDIRQDWGLVLKSLGSAITHSRLTADIVRKALGEDFPIAAIPAPVFDAFARGEEEELPGPRLTSLELDVLGHVFEAPRIPSRPRGSGENPKSPPLDASWPGKIASSQSAGRIFHRKEPLPPPGTPRPRAKRTLLQLQGIVYTATFNPEDGRKNWQEIVRCFGAALGDREDAVLVLKVIHNGPPWGVRRRFRQTLNLLGPLRCRMILLDGYLDDASYRRLVRATTYVVNASLGEGQCLPLMETMSAGRPAIAPDHTGMADYVDSSNAFLVGSSLEPTAFPDDPSIRLRTWRHRIDAHSLFTAFRESYRVAVEDPDRYLDMSRSAAVGLRDHCSIESCRAALKSFFANRPPDVERPASDEDLRNRRGYVLQQNLRLKWTKRRRSRVDSQKPPKSGPIGDIALDFVLAGFGKCGTTTLSTLLDAHPQIFLPEKESWYFSSGSTAPEQAFLDFFSKSAEGQKLGLCGVSYSSVRDEAFARDRILRHYPDVRFLFLVRDPLARVESMYREYHHSWHWTALPRPPFDVAQTLQRIPQIAENTRYGARIAHYAQRVPADRIRVLFFEDLLRDPAATLRSCYEFLGVDLEVPPPAAIPRKNPGKGKLRDTDEMREILDPSIDSATAFAFKVLDLEERDQIAAPLGLRVPNTELPGWSEDVRREFVAEIEDDLREFLRKNGKPEDYWPRCAAFFSQKV